MAFEINFLDEAVPPEWLVNGESALLGEIRIDDFHERFAINTDYWTRADYIRQWIDAIERLSKGNDSSALITQLYDDPHARYGATTWPLYKEGDSVYIQNHTIPAKELKHPFELEAFYSVIPKREVPDKKDKFHISEWVTSQSNLEEWATKLKQVA